MLRQKVGYDFEYFTLDQVFLFLSMFPASLCNRSAGAGPTSRTAGPTPRKLMPSPHATRCSPPMHP